MKRICIVISLFIAMLFSSCSNQNSNRTGNLTVSESENEYKILAEYPEQNTRQVEHYMNEKIGDRNHISFVNSVIDAELTLDDGTKMNVINKPGILKIKFDKAQNSHSSLEEIRSLGEGLKSFLNVPSQP